MSTPIIAPSVLAADFGNIAAGIETIERTAAEWIHLDVMDGHFVPPITFGPKMVKDIRSRTRRFLDVHLMIDEPGQHVDAFIEAGADGITFHAEAEVHAHRLVQRIRNKNVSPGVAIVPSTPIAAISELLSEIDLLLVMTVNPGYGGQSLIPRCLEKVGEAAAIRADRGLSFRIQVDGGINVVTASQARAAGVDVLVSGSSFFAAADPIEYVSELQRDRAVSV